MLNYYFYPTLIMICILLCIYGIKNSHKKLTYKLKFIVNTCLILLILRYLALIVFLVSKNMIFLYYLKPFVFLEILALPVLTLLTCYIVVRNNGFKLYYVTIFYIINLITYCLFIKFISLKLVFTNNYGYGFKFLGNINIIFVAIITYNLLTLFIFIISRKNNKNLLGSILIIVSLIMLNFESFMRIFNSILLLQEILLWDFSVLISFLYIVHKKK